MVHFEIGCRNSAATQASYQEMFDWKIEQMGPAAMIQTGGSGGIGGHITALGHESHHYVTVYVQVDDIRAALAKAEALGGKTVVPAVNISPAPSPGLLIPKAIPSGYGNRQRPDLSCNPRELAVDYREVASTGSIRER